MTGAVTVRPQMARVRRVLGAVRDLIAGSLLCLTPITAILALGWITRRMAASIDRRWGGAGLPAGWILGPPGAAALPRLLGGLAANVRIGLRTGVGLFALTLPVTLAWWGAWWAGWENSFNKGYEQAAVGPSVWALATLIALPVLAHLPLALAHAAAADRFGAFFEWHRIRSVGVAAGWRLVWLAILSAALSVPFFALRAALVFIEGIVPGFAEMSVARQTEIAGQINLIGAALAFAAAVYVRHRACVIYADAAPRAASGRHAPLWQGHRAQGVTGSGQVPTRLISALWLGAACAVWLAVPVLIVAGQFMNYDPGHWLVHPVVTLPWAG